MDTHTLLSYTCYIKMYPSGLNVIYMLIGMHLFVVRRKKEEKEETEEPKIIIPPEIKVY